jgi:hypothetical protein
VGQVTPACGKPGTCVGPGVGVAPTGVGVGVGVGVGEPLGVGVADPVGVGVGDPLGVGVGDPATANANLHTGAAALDGTLAVGASGFFPICRNWIAVSTATTANPTVAKDSKISSNRFIGPSPN